MRKMTRKPSTPGEILNEEFIKPLALTQKQLADHIGVDIKVINRIIKERTGISPIVAVKLGYALKTSDDFWLNAQTALDLYYAEAELKTPLEPITKDKSA